MTPATEMSDRWKEHFPENPEQAKNWVPIVHRHELSMVVVAVARTRIEGAWGAYIDAVPGYDHDAEQDKVLSNGTKLREDVARVLFPEFEGVPYAA